MSDENAPADVHQVPKESAPERLPWPEDTSEPGPDGSVTVRVRRWDLPKKP